MDKEVSLFEKIVVWFEEHIVGVLVILVLLTVGLVFHHLDYWNAIGLLVLNLGLGIKLQGAKTFAVAVAKSGGKKALAMTTAGVLLKRHAIDIASKYFAEHSVARYKHNVIKVAKIKFQAIKDSTPVQKAKAVGSTLLSIPILYFFWTKVLGTAIQKFLYALIYPIFAGLFNFIAMGFNFVAGFITFILQLTLLNYIIEWIERRPVGKAILNGLGKFFTVLGDILNYVNKAFILVGLDPKHRLVMWSTKFNRWLERIITKGMNARQKILQRRTIHQSSRENLLLKREAKKRIKKVALKKRAKLFFDKKVLKKTTWQERRVKRQEPKYKKESAWQKVSTRKILQR